MTTTPNGKRVSEMDAEHQRFLDAQQTTTRCAYCPWKYDGTAADGRLEAERHRRDEHPDRAQGGALAEAFERRKRRRKPWTREEVVDAFVRFWEEHGRWPVPNDIPLCPYLPSMNTVQKVPGSWPGARDLAVGALAASLPNEEPEPTPSPPPPPPASERPRERGTRAVSKEGEAVAAFRLRAVLHQLADAVVDYLEDGR